MGRKIKIKGGVDEMLSDVTALTSDTRHVISKAVYDGAGLVADAYREAAQGIPTVRLIYVHESTGWQKYGITPEQKEGILKGIGVAHFRYDTGEVQTKVGVDGYNSVVTPRWPKGQPNVMIARALTNGNSFLRAYDFVGKAKRNVEVKAEAKMKETLKAEIDKRIK